ncbi:MAG: hypothetical protein ACKV2Q_33140 [Planctomycetaceae bacterium]
MNAPLNPKLYRALCRAFGHVKISNEGERYVASQQANNHRGGRHETPPSHSGEYYRASCPFCSDTRQRLFVNHMFAVRDATGDDHLYLAHCFNESCLDSRTRQRELFERIYPYDYGLRQDSASFRGTVTQAPLRFEQVTPARLPAPLLALSSPGASAANIYLESRGFDTEELTAKWEVAFCPASRDPRPAFVDRLVLPIYTIPFRFEDSPKEDPTKLVGWQARAIHDCAEEHSKYLTMAGMKKNECLYGLPQAINSDEPIVVVEGATDVWRLGRNAVATLGKSISPKQLYLFVRHFDGRPAAVMYDADAATECRKAADKIREMRRSMRDDAPVRTVELTRGRSDVGECKRADAWNAIHRALR